MENNELIAQFMEFKSTNKCVRNESGKYYDYHAHPEFSCIKKQKIQIESEYGCGLVEQDYLFIEDLKFKTSWEWLMPVAEKIESYKAMNDWFRIEFYKCDDSESSFNANIYRMRTEGKEFVCGLDNYQNSRIKALYYVIVNFIKWYNSCQPTQ